MAGKAVKISGRVGRFDFINDQYEPMADPHNGKPCYVARAVAPRYMFHSGQSRWVISKCLDDGYRCWAYVQSAETTQDPTDCQGPWQVCDTDGSWRPDPKVTSAPVAASMDKFVQLRMTLDGEMRQYGLIDTSSLKKLWRKLDYNGNNVVSLAEIDKMVVEMCSNGVWPAWLNNKPALMRAYKKTILKDGDGDDWVEKKEFHALLLNIFWFNRLWEIFEHVDGDHDRRVDAREFQGGMNALGLNMSPTEAQQEFAKVDTNGGGQVLFVELCAYVRQRVNPDSHAEFDADIVSGEHCGKASYNKVSHGHHAAHGGHHAAPHTATRELDFSAMSAPQGASTMSRGLGDSSSTMTRGLGGGYDGGGGGQSEAQVSRNGPTDTLRQAGGKEHAATKDHQFKCKTFKDFDDLEDKIKAMCTDKAGLKNAWSHLDYNGNGIVSLAEIDKWAVENYPLLNHKPALMRCYKCTIKTGKHHDDWVHRVDFKKMIVNMFYFNKLYWIFDEANGDDRRMTFPEFQMVLTLCGTQMSPSQAQQEFSKCDKNGGGMILFDEFCHYFASRQCPQGLTDFTDDGTDRTGADGTGAVLHHAGHAMYHATGHGHVARNSHAHHGRY